jgi:carbonyl reductase 1
MESLTLSEKVVVVTGANRGIGYAIVRGFLKQDPNLTVYLTSRDQKRGEDAVKRLSEEVKGNLRYFQLDIDDLESIRRFRDHIRANHKRGIHILVNNAGILPEIRAAEDMKASKEAKSEQGHVCKFDREAIRATVRNNYFSTLNVCQELLPLLGEDARVLFLGTRMSQLALKHTREDLQMKLKSCTRIEEVSSLMERLMDMDPGKLYRSDEKESKDAWLTQPPGLEVYPGYHLGSIYPWAMSKLGVILLSQIYQRQYDAEKKSQNVHFNVVGPGLVRTHMNPKGVKTPDEGADSVVWLALQPSSCTIKGNFVCERKLRDPFGLPPSGEPIFP